MTNTLKGFDLEAVIHHLKHYLPSQTPLKDFIHHNSLHAFQEMPFYEAIFTSSAIFGHQATFSITEYRNLYAAGRIRPEILEKVTIDRKGARDAKIWLDKALYEVQEYWTPPRIGRLRAYWKTAYKTDLDNLVQPLLFRLLCSYLDQGIALWHFPFVENGLIPGIRNMEQNGLSSFFKARRARRLLFDEQASVETLLELLVGDEALYEQYLFDQQFSHRGWSGMVAAIEDRPDTILYPKKIALRELIFFELLLELDALDAELGEDWAPLAQIRPIKPTDLFEPIELTAWHEALMIWQDAFEWSYYDEVLSGLKMARAEAQEETPGEKSFQAVFCIDERECSIRRHIESVDPRCETLGAPGFFGVEFFFHPANSQFYEKLCPAPVTPKYLIKEKESSVKRKHELLHTKKSHTFLRGFFMSLSLGGVAAFKLVKDLFNPTMSPAISNAFAHMHLDAELIFENTDINQLENGLQIGFTCPEMADRVEGVLRGIGLNRHFAPVVYMVAHGSSSANNPHHGAHDCGACSGRPGSVNARVFAAMANHPGVRAILHDRGLHIPDATQFIGALHDTAGDEIAFYDENILSPANAAAHQKNKAAFEDALDLNAKERSRRFASINTRKDIKKVREAIRKRSVSYFEPRPELGHGTNALCFVGHRNLTKNLFLDRRAFMNSYDYRTDPDGQLLLGVMKPLPPVCGGINLEYYFSRIDNQKLGAGTKLPHNVMGLIGVANSSDGDLRPGLPLQMIEVHDPIRLLILVEHYPEVVLKTVQSQPDLYEWFVNDWVHLAAIHPDNNRFYRFRGGAFEEYMPLKNDVAQANDIHRLIEAAKEMETNHIIHATRENLPVHIMKKQ
jgi:uncharacterized protein YbcC (UPF0753/DUF2309 family)